ncbi:MAG: S8 family serine peptidase, partial [Ilumatobacteraceae bacterium]
HGTHVAGTIGGVGGNGLGVAGVNWNVTMISAKFLGATGGAISDAVNALNYLVDLKTRHGLNIVATSNSWGGGGYSQAMLDSINASGNANMLFIAAAGNSGANNDTTASYPSNYQCTNGGTRGWDCVVAVAATDSAGGIASFSQYGATTVDIGAPGVGVWSSVPQGSYASYNGTSMATPHVSGAVALCASIDPTLSAPKLRDILTAAAAPTASLTGKTVTGGRLDVGAMVSRCVSVTVPVTGSVSNLAASAASSTSVNLTWTDGASDESLFQTEKAVSTTGVCGTWSLAGQSAPNTTSSTVTGLAVSTTYCFRVRAGNGYIGGTFTPWSNEATATTLTPTGPGAFNKTSPANNATGISRASAKLSWGTSSGATRYEYCFDTTNDNACSNWVSTGTGRSVTLRSLGSLTLYYWHVRAWNAAGGVTYSNSNTFWSFRTRT